MGSMKNAFAAILALVAMLRAVPSFADAPGRGITADFEVNFLVNIIDHHFTALRLTELAAGTDPARDSAVSNPMEGVANTPGFSPTAAKSSMDPLKSLARRENRVQREEIATAQRFLHDWYGMSHDPSVPPSGQPAIAALEAAPAGPAFDHLFMEYMSRHHFIAVEWASQCLVSSELTHDDLRRYCRGIQHSQISDIQDMRKMLCKQFGICDYQPLEDPRGRHSGEEPSQPARVDFGQ